MENIVIFRIITIFSWCKVGGRKNELDKRNPKDVRKLDFGVLWGMDESIINIEIQF